MRNTCCYCGEDDGTVKPYPRYKMYLCLCCVKNANCDECGGIGLVLGKKSEGYHVPTDLPCPNGCKNPKYSHRLKV